MRFNNNEGREQVSSLTERASHLSVSDSANLNSFLEFLLLFSKKQPPCPYTGTIQYFLSRYIFLIYLFIYFCIHNDFFIKDEDFKSYWHVFKHLCNSVHFCPKSYTENNLLAKNTTNTLNILLHAGLGLGNNLVQRYTKFPFGFVLSSFKTPGE